MEYNNTDGLLNENDYSNIFTKESRTVRVEKLKVKKEFHKKNPKSIEYYKNLQTEPSLNENSIQTIGKNMTLSTTELTEETVSSLNTPSKKYNNKNGGKLTQTLKTELTTKQTVNKNTAKNIASKNISNINSTNGIKTSTNTMKNPATVSPKFKANIQLMFQNIAKHYKKDGLFFDNSNGYDAIIVMKDVNIHSKIGKVNTNFTLRTIVGTYHDLKKVVANNGTHFSPLKHDFSLWLSEQLNKSKPQEDFDKKIASVYSTYQNDSRIIKFLPALEEKLIQALKKPSKQTQGFIKKIDQINSSWNNEIQEIIHIEEIENELRFSSYEDSFPLARAMNRKFSIYIGPTNSGKTYTALNELASAKSGAYLGPLRLMAHEGKESLLERGIIANLITGEERQELPGATHVSSTVEMCNMGKMIDVAVIDEIQMISDESRGWAWSQALIGVPAKHIILVGSEESLPFIIPVIKNLCEEFEIKEFERKNALEIREPIYKLKELKNNDCVVVFSRKNALEMKNAIESAGKRCSVIYGNLSPEVRKSEANKFKSGENPILVATDAIGMGLNLPINRLFFSTMEKFDGITSRLLSTSEVKQIAGRSGRYGFANHGEVGLLFEGKHEWSKLLQNAIYAGYDKPTDVRIPIGPNLKQIQTICNTLGKQDLYSALIFFKEKMIKNHKLYKTANLESMIEIASLIKNKNLDLATGLNYACVPLDISSDTHIRSFFKWINNHISEKGNPAPLLPDVVTDKKNDSYSLYEAENYVKLCMAYRWLHYKYPLVYNEIETVTNYGKTTNDYIEHALHRHIVISRNPKWRK